MKTTARPWRKALHATLAVAIGVAAVGCSKEEKGIDSEAAGDCAYPPDSVVEIHIPGSVGGGSDTTARTLAPHLSRLTPGHPNIQIKNYPDALQVTAANQFLRTPDDGSNILALSRSSTYPVVLGLEGVEYGFDNLTPIVGFQTGALTYSRSDLGIKDGEGLAKYGGELIYGASSPVGGNTPTLLSFELLGLDPKTVFGYDGSGPVRVAFEQGEVNINYDTSASVLEYVDGQIEKGAATPLFTFGVMENGKWARDPMMPDYPTLEEVYTKAFGKEPSGVEWDAFNALTVPGLTLNKSLWLHKSAPEWAKCALGKGVEALMNDEEFNKNRGEEIGPYALYRGKELQDLVERVFNIPEESLDWLRTWLHDKYDADFKDFE